MTLYALYKSTSLWTSKTFPAFGTNIFTVNAVHHEALYLHPLRRLQQFNVISLYAHSLHSQLPHHPAARVLHHTFYPLQHAQCLLDRRHHGPSTRARVVQKRRRRPRRKRSALSSVTTPPPNDMDPRHTTSQSKVISNGIDSHHTPSRYNSTSDDVNEPRLASHPAESSPDHDPMSPTHQLTNHHDLKIHPVTPINVTVHRRMQMSFRQNRCVRQIARIYVTFQVLTSCVLIVLIVWL